MRYALAALGFLASSPALAYVWCTLTNVQVQAYDHGGTYIVGTVSGAGFGSIFSLCGLNNDCTSKATDRRTAVALAAQMSGKAVMTFWPGKTNCSQLVIWESPNVVAIVNQ